MEPTQDLTGVVQKPAGSCSGPKRPQHPLREPMVFFRMGGMTYDGAPSLQGPQPRHSVWGPHTGPHGLAAHQDWNPISWAFSPGRTRVGGKGRTPSHDPTCPVQGQTAMEDQEAQMHSELKVTWPRWFRSGSKSVPRLRNGRGLTLSSCVGQIHLQGTGNGRRLATANVRSSKCLATPCAPWTTWAAGSLLSGCEDARGACAGIPRPRNGGLQPTAT